MKKTIFFTILLLFSITIKAQWISPGTGSQYTLATIAAADPSVVSDLQNGVYQIHQNITISRGDVLAIESTTNQVSVDGNVTLTIQGSLVIEERDGMLPFSGDTTANGFELRIDSAMTTTLAHVCFAHGDRVTLIETDIILDSCEFREFTSAAIQYMNCNPTIQNCYFHDNHAAAVSSGVNVTGSARILNNVFYNNVLDNGNYPQINLGPGAADTLFIVGNHIEGVASSMSGGIGIMNVYGLGNTVMMVQGNTIVHNRYGYTQNGRQIHAIIEDNIIQDNNLEVNPNNGGSGISLYGSDTTCSARIRHNLISGNLWGVTAIYYHNIDMGTATDPGGNVLYNNGNGGTEYELYNNAFSDMNAVGNYWGANDSTHAETVIFHREDSPNYGRVNYLPIMNLEPELLGFEIRRADNPQLTEDLYGYFDDLGDTLFFIVGCLAPGNVYSPLKPNIKIPLGVSCSPSPEEPQIFTSPVTYTLSTPHGTTRKFTVVIKVFGGIPDHSIPSIQLYPNPAQTQITVVSEQGIMDRVQIYDVYGKLLKTIRVNVDRITIDVQEFPAGIYFVRVETDSGVAVKRVVVGR